MFYVFIPCFYIGRTYKETSNCPDQPTQSLSMITFCSRKDKHFDIVCYTQLGLGAQNFLAIGFPEIIFSYPETNRDSANITLIIDQANIL